MRPEISLSHWFAQRALRTPERKALFFEDRSWTFADMQRDIEASRIVLLHVADGWAARTYGPDAISPEITEDTAYLEKIRAEFQSAGISAEAELAYGDPGDEIIKWIETKGCDLVAMSTHGHGFLADLFLGSASRRVRHRVSVPVLLLRAK